MISIDTTGMSRSERDAIELLITAKMGSTEETRPTVESFLTGVINDFVKSQTEDFTRQQLPVLQPKAMLYLDANDDERAAVDEILRAVAERRSGVSEEAP